MPSRTAAGYRTYDDHDVVVVAQIRTMRDAGLNAALVRRYLDCARTGEHGTSLEMCPDLRATLDGLADRFDREARALEHRRARLAGLAAAPAAPSSRRVRRRG
ncbi:MerR family transcriptional regulator [Nocardioides sp. CPCC 205120]|uniref:MerR family transcriptional regulator n=1 Tax=Nocardioides sp. CPCC 205120 TaxID=3406462 RepID=UPI003B51526A